ncbi:MAG: hypothetical protein QOK48_2859 [Blastocatellia bacterium]|nr:hypothetical protein [Blastocatellia bacterium]
METQEKATSNDGRETENIDAPLTNADAHVSTSEARIWNNLANIKFKALYTCECSRIAGLSSRALSFLLALTSASSVGAWTLWQQHRNIWAVIIGVGQVLLIALPHFPFLKSEKEFLSMSFDFEGLYLRYEQLWYDFRDSTIDESFAKTQINELRAREVEIEKAGVRCPRIQRWMNRVATDAKSVLKLDLV